MSNESGNKLKIIYLLSILMENDEHWLIQCQTSLGVLGLDEIIAEEINNVAINCY